MGDRTLKSGSKHGVAVDKTPSLTGRHLRKWLQKHGQHVQSHILRGAAYAFGSGLMTWCFIWAQHHI
jgi:hypothetical protein